MHAFEHTRRSYKKRDLHQLLATLALALTALTIWTLTHEYRGLVLDGQIYAVQAIAKLRPALNADLFMQNTTQDRFTLFPRLYAWVIFGLGLNRASLVLTAACTIWFLYAAWRLVDHHFGRDHAWLAVFLLLITGGNYGAYGVFHFLEPFMTARLLAEALVITSLSFYLRGHTIIGVALATMTLLIHPIMALPGLLLMLCLGLRLRTSTMTAVVGVIACLGFASIATVVASATAPAESVVNAVPGTGPLSLIDADWLGIVRERSQFLFLQLWRLNDWALNTRPFICLTLATLLLTGRPQKLAACAMLVGATGLALAAIASLLGPVALLVQGQAWRWMWVTSFVSVVLLLPTARRLWNSTAAGRPCALLLVAAWSFAADVGFVFACAAMIMWALRDHRWLHADGRDVSADTVIARAVIAVIALVGAFDTWAAFWPAAKLPPMQTSFLTVVRTLFSLRIWTISLAILVWAMMKSSQAWITSTLGSFALASYAAVAISQSLAHTKSYGASSDIEAFADWRRAIPPEGTVFVTDGHDSGSFVWFTLQRNNYLSPGQSAGVVFSRATALEVRRRSEVLRSLVEPNWKMSSMLSGASGAPHPYHHPLTAGSLLEVCSDKALNFVIAPNDVGFQPLQHHGNDAYDNWNLYDCRRTRGVAAT